MTLGGARAAAIICTLAAAALAVATIDCDAHDKCQQQQQQQTSAELVRAVSRARFETRRLAPPRLAQCLAFSELASRDQVISAHVGQATGGQPGPLAPLVLLQGLARALEARAAQCAAAGGGGGASKLAADEQTSSLASFVADCRELVELSERANQSSEPAPRLQAAREITLHKDWRGKVGFQLESLWGGVFVALVYAGSPAARAGLRFGDQIEAINGRPAAGDSWPFVASEPDELKLRVRPAPFQQTRVIERHATDGQDNNQQALSPALGMEFETRPGGKSAAAIKSVARNSPAARAGLLEGLQIVSVNNKTVLGLKPGELARALWDAGPRAELKLLPAELCTLLTRGVRRRKVREQGDKIAAGATSSQ